MIHVLKNRIRIIHRLKQNIQMKSINSSCELYYSSVPNIPIAEFYAGKSIFFTGGTGFLGKMVLERLLYSCPNLNRIFMLLRADSEDHAKQRIGSMFNSPMSQFQRLNSGSILKIVPVIGDLGAQNLGIQPHNIEQIMNEVSIVLHCAATINFNEPLQVAMKYNVEGTREVLRLAKRLKNIEAFVHVSTMYCVASSDRTVLEERLYPAPTTIDRVYRALEGNRKPTSDVLCGYVNTYVFTKLLAEHVVAEERGDIPLVILRPSMVGSCFHEPVKGYMDVVNLHSYLMYMIAKRCISVMYARANNILDIVPADYVANMIIVAAARCPRSNELTVYNCASSSCNPLTLEGLADLGAKYLDQTAPNELLARKTIFVDYKILARVIRFVVQSIPTYIMHVWSKIRGNNQSSLRSLKYQFRKFDEVEFYYRNSWMMKADRARSLHNSLSDADKLEFYCDPVDISWKEYIPLYIKRIRHNCNAKSKSISG